MQYYDPLYGIKKMKAPKTRMCLHQKCDMSPVATCSVVMACRFLDGAGPFVAGVAGARAQIILV